MLRQTETETERKEKALTQPISFCLCNSRWRVTTSPTHQQTAGKHLSLQLQYRGIRRTSLFNNRDAPPMPECGLSAAQLQMDLMIPALCLYRWKCPRHKELCGSNSFTTLHKGFILLSMAWSKLHALGTMLPSHALFPSQRSVYYLGPNTCKLLFHFFLHLVACFSFYYLATLTPEYADYFQWAKVWSCYFSNEWNGIERVSCPLRAISIYCHVTFYTLFDLYLQNQTRIRGPHYSPEATKELDLYIGNIVRTCFVMKFPVLWAFG